ncbi:MAG: hypothetical protein QM831_32730 [Kofleriaceae bacterium]
MRVVLALLVLAGCATNTPGKDMFDSDIQPLISSTCATAGCHASPGDSVHLDYDSLMTNATVYGYFYPDHLLATMMIRSSDGGLPDPQHIGTYWTGEQQVTISDWVNLEASERK